MGNWGQKSLVTGATHFTPFITVDGAHLVVMSTFAKWWYRLHKQRGLRLPRVYLGTAPNVFILKYDVFRWVMIEIGFNCIFAIVWQCYILLYI